MRVGAVEEADAVGRSEGKRERISEKRAKKHQFFCFVFVFVFFFFFFVSPDFAMATNRHSSGDIPIEPSLFDLIVLGTGLPESLVAR